MAEGPLRSPFGVLACSGPVGEVFSVEIPAFTIYEVDFLHLVTAFVD